MSFCPVCHGEYACRSGCNHQWGAYPQGQHFNSQQVLVNQWYTPSYIADILERLERIEKLLEVKNETT